MEQDTSRRRLRLRPSARNRRSAWRRGRLRRLTAALLAAAAVWAVVSALRPTPPDPGPLVVVATRDLAAGSVLGADHLSTTHLPPEALPRGAVTDPGGLVGDTTARALRAGQVLTDADTTVAALAQGLPTGTVVALLPLGNPALVTAATPGTRVDVLAVVDGSVLAADVLVLAPAGGQEGGIFVALPSDRAGEVARHTGVDLVGGGVTIVLRPPAEPPG